MNNAYPLLFSPMKLGKATLRNRSIMAAHGMMLGSREGVSDAHRTYLATRAKGGAAAVFFESMPVQAYPNRGRLWNPLPMFSDTILPSLSRTADEVHAAGALLGANLRHGGYNTSFINNRASRAPSVVPSAAGEIPAQISASEIRQLARDFAAAARRARQAGLDIIEVNAGLDYLLGAAMNPTLNRRTDEYGGSAANRARMLAEVLESVREAVADAVTVGVKLSVAHVIRGDPNDFGVEQSLEIVSLLAERGLLDFVDIAKGSYRSGDMLIPPMNVPRMQLREEALRYRAALSIPVIVGHRIRTPQEAESLLRDGAADVIAGARTWIAEPDWMAKIARGEEERIRPCISCNQACAGFTSRNLPGTCVVNPVAGRESELGALTTSSASNSLVVIGGGPAGMEVARVAATRGRSVTLYEAGDRLGGWMRIAAESPHRGEMMLPLLWWESELRRLGVRIHLGHAVQSGEDFGDSDVVWAIGAQPSDIAIRQFRPFLFDGIPGTENLPHGRDVLTGAHAVSGHILIIDEEGGWPVVSLVESLAARPEVERLTVLTTEAAELGETTTRFTLEGYVVQSRLATLPVEIHLNQLVAEVRDGRVTLADGSVRGPFDHIILSTGTEARPIPEGAIAAGDCVAPRGIWAAVNDAYRLAAAL